MNKHDSAVQNKVGHPPIPDSTDFISQMPNDILVMILSLLTLKNAVITGSLSSRWRSVWCNLIKLDIDGSEAMGDMNDKDCVLKRFQYVNQVYSVIKSHTNPMVKFFRICFDLDNTYFQDIDNWIQFALHKKVKHLEVNLMEHRHIDEDTEEKYDFPLPLSYGNMVHLSEWPTSNYMAVKTLSLKELHLLRVNLNQLTLNELVKHSPHLVTLYMFGSSLSTEINVGGQGISLKRLELVACSGVESISLYDFNLVKFTYHGPEIELRISNLPKLVEVNVGQISVGLENNVFGQISSCVSYIQVLSLDIDNPEEGLNVNAIPVLPKIKKLRLTFPAYGDDSLLEFTSIAKACPNLENFLISLHWCSQIISTRNIRHVPSDHPYRHLKLFKIVGYDGRISDLELAVHVIDNAPALKKIVIDPTCGAFYDDLTVLELRKREKAARSCAKQQLAPILPSGVELVVL